MPFTVPRRFGCAVLVLGLCPVLALAESGSTPKTGRTWTDPPAREAPGPQAEAAKPATKPPALSPATAPSAATARPTPVATHAAIRPAQVTRLRPAPRAKVAARPVILPRQRFGLAEQSPAVTGRRPVYRAVTMRPPARRTPPFARYGSVPGAVPASSMAYDEVRAVRVGDGGYVLIPSHGFPVGGLRAYRPFDGDD